MTIQQQIIKEAKTRGYTYYSIAKEIGIPDRSMLRYFKCETTSVRITNILFEKFNGNLTFSS